MRAFNLEELLLQPVKATVCRTVAEPLPQVRYREPPWYFLPYAGLGQLWVPKRSA